jgi:hypothetical protein
MGWNLSYIIDGIVGFNGCPAAPTKLKDQSKGNVRSRYITVKGNEEFFQCTDA